MELPQKIRQFALSRSLFNAGDGVLLAVSGGPDSVALLHIINSLKHEWDLYLEVAHLQHGIRGEAAKEDARFVAALAEELELPFHLREIDLPQMKSKAGKGNLEALARAERYRFFAEIARERKLAKVATAHTVNDQAETVLMWTFRGAGTKGLGGMAPLQRMDSLSGCERALVIVRPLLEISKPEILEYLQQKSFACRVDETNQDTSLLRNWLRLELLPMAERRIGENLATRLSRQAELTRDEDELLDQAARRQFAALLGPCGVDRLQFNSEPKALRRRILRLWIEQVRKHLRGLDFVHVEDVIRLTEGAAPQGRTSLPGGWELVREYDSLRLERARRGSTRPCYSYPFEPGKDLLITEAGVQIHSERITGPVDRWPRDLSEAIFDLDLLPRNLTVRNFRPGDRFSPFGMTGHKKVKDLLIDSKVPLSIRATLPLLTAGQEVFWVPGYARSEAARVTDRSRSLIRIKLASISA